MNAVADRRDSQVGLSFRVAATASEIGVRIALGAKWSRIVRQVLALAGLILAAGALTGVALALLVGRTIHNVLYEVSSADVASSSRQF